MRELADLVARIVMAAADAAKIIADDLAAREPDAIEIGYPSDDHEAQALGLSCVGAWRHLAGLVIAALVSDGIDPRRIRLVPRGATGATALAIEAREGAL